MCASELEVTKDVKTCGSTVLKMNENFRTIFIGEQIIFKLNYNFSL